MDRIARMPSKDIDYYRARAETERRLAAEAANEEVAEIHEELAIQYEALVERADLRPTLHIAAAAPRQFPPIP